jgi:DUF4097 and DUF4098 domain-containing protein YvlB
VAGDGKVETGSGWIKLEHVQGGLHAETGSGSISVSGKPTNNWKLETGSGSIDLHTGNSPMNLDASTGSGTVHVNVPFSGNADESHHHVSGKVSGGGPTVVVEAGSGSVTIN